MNLRYVDYPEYKRDIKNVYLESFPKNERFPFWILKQSLKKGKSSIKAILDDEKFIGMLYLVNCDDSFYLMFFAIKNQLRNKNYGSNVLKDLNKKYKTLFLSIEKPSDEISRRRKRFYLRNGFYETKKYCKDAGVDYEILCNNKNYVLTEATHKKRYDNMTDSKLVKLFIYKPI
jgi:hypothetical protein